MLYSLHKYQFLLRKVSEFQSVNKHIYCACWHFFCCKKQALSLQILIGFSLFLRDEINKNNIWQKSQKGSVIMVSVTAANVLISKGYENAPALKFSENGESVQFNIGWKVYAPKAENESRWINYHVKAFGPVCSRIKKMNLKDGSCVNLYGRLDEDVWTDKNSGETIKRHVIILDSIEFAYTGSKSKDGANGNSGGTPIQNPNGQYAPAQGQVAPDQAAQQMANQGQYAPQGYVQQGYANQQQQAPQGYVNQQQAAPQNAPSQSKPQQVGSAADFAGFNGFTPFEGSNMFPI